MGSGGVAIAALPTVICLKVPFSDGLGGGAGGKSSTGGIFTASSGVSIRQCWRMLLRFVVHNLRISPFTNINALTECLVPQLVYCLCQLVNYIWFPLV